MQATYVQPGNVVNWTNATVANVAVGDIVPIGNLGGRAETDIPIGATGAVAVRGVFDVVQAAVTFALGGPVYWDADGDPVGGTRGTGAATSVPTGNIFLGFALQVTAATDATVRTILRAVESSAAESLTLAQLGDVGTIDYTAGRLLITDNDSVEDQAVTGPFTLSGAGVIGVKVATVAATGADQAGAAAIAEGFTAVTAANDAMGVRLPTAAAGKLCIVKNTVTNKILLLYPEDADKINGGSANVALSMAAGTSAILVAYDATDWYTIPLLPS